MPVRAAVCAGPPGTAAGALTSLHLQPGTARAGGVRNPYRNRLKKGPISRHFVTIHPG